MRTGIFRRGEWNSPLTLFAVSGVVLAVLVVALWRPWESRGIAGNRKLTFHCAAGTTKPITEIIKKYQEAHGVEVQVAYGGTGALLSAIRATDGKGDLYLAADEYHMHFGAVFLVTHDHRAADFAERTVELREVATLQGA